MSRALMTAINQRELHGPTDGLVLTIVFVLAN